jgi:hypothetical protein
VGAKRDDLATKLSGGHHQTKTTSREYDRERQELPELPVTEDDGENRSERRLASRVK